MSRLFSSHSPFQIESTIFHGCSHTRTLAGDPAKPSNLCSKVKVSESQIAVPLLLFVRCDSAMNGEPPLDSWMMEALCREVRGGGRG
jgi:hypothetical protein